MDMDVKGVEECKGTREERNCSAAEGVKGEE